VLRFHRPQPRPKQSVVSHTVELVPGKLHVVLDIQA
jgi:hypothetical protein